jgi:uncharacterized protein DUF5989
MSAPTGSAASSLTDEASPDMPPANRCQSAKGAAVARRRGGYLEQLALRRQTLAIRQTIVYGLVVGWILVLGGGFFYCCVPGRVDWLWASLIVAGFLHLATAVVVPQLLYWPERAWMAIARCQGWLVMMVLLTVVYFALLWPASYFSRRRTRGFVSWQVQPSDSPSAWQSIDVLETEPTTTSGGRARSLPLLLFGVLGFFFRRGNYVLFPILVLLLVLGLVLYFVQSTALAPFIYTLF